MKTKSFILGACFFLIGGAMSLSNAATVVTADLTGSPFRVREQIDFSVNGIDFYATGYTGGLFARQSYVNQSSDGLGVTSYLVPILEPMTQIDGIGGDEGLLLTFKNAVTLVSATFGGVGDNDEFRLLVDGSKIINSAYISGNNPYDFTDLAYGSITGREFFFTVTERNDDYFLSSISVQAVPLPASALLLVSGLFGLVFIRRRGH